jgi:hypothetical protein
VILCKNRREITSVYFISRFPRDTLQMFSHIPDAFCMPRPFQSR